MEPLIILGVSGVCGFLIRLAKLADQSAASQPAPPRPAEEQRKLDEWNEMKRRKYQHEPNPLVESFEPAPPGVKLSNKVDNEHKVGLILVVILCVVFPPVLFLVIPAVLLGGGYLYKTKRRYDRKYKDR